jgi:rod shape-determining protein MreD
VKSVALALGLVAALAIQTTLAPLLAAGVSMPDLVLLMVVYIALVTGPMTGLLVGSAAGLVQDALSSGIIGIGGLSKTVCGFLVGLLAAQFILTAPMPRFVVYVAATALHAVLFMGLYALLGLRSFDPPSATVGWQALANGIIGVVVFQTVEWLPGFAARRRARRPLKR